MYSASTISPKRAMKVFYKITTNSIEAVQKQENEVEELQLPNYVFTSLRTNLKASTNILPPSAQHHQGWTIGLLDR